MKFNFNIKRSLSLKVCLPPTFFLIILIISVFMIFEICLMFKQVKVGVIEESNGVLIQCFNKIEKSAQMLHRLNSSAPNLARTLSIYLNGTELSFDTISTSVAPLLFLALSTIPQLSQVSFIGLDDLFFSFYNDKDQTFAVYSNTSFSSKWYTKPVNRDSGMSYGDPVTTDSMVTVNASWIQNTLNSTNGYSSLGTTWNNDNDTLFLNTAAMDGRGVISLGFPIKVITDHFAALSFYGGYFQLGTVDGQVIVQTKLPNTTIDISNGTVTVHMWTSNGVYLGPNKLSCNSDDTKSSSLDENKVGVEYIFYCSKINVAGVKSVYILAYPRDGLVSLVNKNSALSLMLQIFVFVLMIISLCIYIFLTARAKKKEMFLCAALIKQTEATQQAERKSMNKTKAYAGASHDVRSSLAALRDLIQLCWQDNNLDSRIRSNLEKMENCTKDLVGILNSILDASKIEAGKTSLEKEDFNLAILLDEVVDMYYPMGLKKGLDVILDPCDGSIMKYPLVRGDRLKLKQILCNLLNNAIKFTSEGHISVRAVVRKNNFKKEIIASNRTTMLKFFSLFCCWNEDGFSDLDALHSAEENPNEMEFIFEVDDTGKGIPKDKQKSVFEDYVQVKETDGGQEGCGLGLGIVQSLVRVMKGELRIVEKEPGERGTCFEFNVFLSICKPEFAVSEAVGPSFGFHQHFGFMSPKHEGSHAIMFICGEERRKVLKKYIESLNIKVTIIKQARNFHSELDKIKRKLLEVSCYVSPGRTEFGVVENLNKSGALNPPSFVVLVIDASAPRYYSNFHHTLTSFRKDIPKSLCKVVWLDDQSAPHAICQVQDGITSDGDLVVYKPFHGQRLTQVLSLLPEFRGATYTTETTAQEEQHCVDIDLPNSVNCLEIEPEIAPCQPKHIMVHKWNEKGHDSHLALSEKKILVVDDDKVGHAITGKLLRGLGADVDFCKNGKEALNRVCKALSNQRMEGSSKSLPYDFILMDCQMPVMDGYKATMLIRKEENHYNVHIPIIALTSCGEQEKSFEAGMDFHITKPLDMDRLLGIVQSIDNNEEEE